MTTTRWLQHWQLNRDPFSKEIDDAELWLPSSKLAVVERLVDTMTERGSVLLVGEPGVGKTCVLRALRHRLPEAGFRLTYCHNATLGRRDFYRQLCTVLGLSPKATAAGVFHDISTHIESLGKERIHPVFLLDESHLLQQEVLDHLHILLNYSWDAKALLSVILVGLPELWDKLDLRRNRSLLSRLSQRIALGQAPADDTAEYTQHRLSMAGVMRQVFEADALTLLHEVSGGILRDIDRLSVAALKAAARRKASSVTREALHSVIEAESAQRRAS
jgi:general secretion pathway protein A